MHIQTELMLYSLLSQTNSFAYSADLRAFLAQPLPPHPFDPPGVLSFNESNAFDTRWEPSLVFPVPNYLLRGEDVNKTVSIHSRPKRHIPRLMSKLVMHLVGNDAVVRTRYEDSVARFKATSQAADVEGEEDEKNEEDEEEDEEEDLEWLRGRTILLLGDSIDRFHLSESLTSALALIFLFLRRFVYQPFSAHLCGFTHVSDPQHHTPWPWAREEDNGISIIGSPSPPSADKSPYPLELQQLEHDLSLKLREGKPWGSPLGRPHVCEIKQLDLVLLWSFSPGLDDGITTPGLVDFQNGTMSTEGVWGERALAQPFGPKAFWPIQCVD